MVSVVSSYGGHAELFSKLRSSGADPLVNRSFLGSDLNLDHDDLDEHGVSVYCAVQRFTGSSEEIYESAKMDGSGPIRIFIQIVLPLSPTIFFALIVSVIGAFQAFGQIHILTKGGPINSTNVIVYSIYQDAFVNFRFGIGAEALILFAIILLLTLAV